MTRWSEAEIRAAFTRALPAVYGVTHGLLDDVIAELRAGTPTGDTPTAGFRPEGWPCCVHCNDSLQHPARHGTECPWCHRFDPGPPNMGEGCKVCGLPADDPIHRAAALSAVEETN